MSAPAMSSRRRLRRRDVRSTHARHFGPNMTPMVDVVLVLLVFFMAGASFLLKTWQTPVEVRARDLPGDASALPALPEARIAIIVREDENGVASVDAFGERGLDRGGFNRAAREAYDAFGAGDVTLMVRPDASASYGLAVWVYDACRGAGFDRVEIEPGG